ncbi:hypothetical protein [Streptosporangium sp. NBC_01469]|uniref:hypothetical protein n=1 Tax=Streptosporangium sp. NBC_01469 TaxID=2903898 RepID=UPI002E2CC6CF|nr:hypothetical protein [Streptosporangium sp. NBC_01469]
MNDSTLHAFHPGARPRLHRLRDERDTAVLAVTARTPVTARRALAPSPFPCPTRIQAGGPAATGRGGRDV